MSKDPREDCPWKCTSDDPKCLCRQVAQIEQDAPASHWRAKYREIFNENKLLRAEIDRLNRILTDCEEMDTI